MFDVFKKRKKKTNTQLDQLADLLRAQTVNKPKDEKSKKLHDMQTFAGHIHPDSSNLPWRSKDGTSKSILSMDTQHLINTIRLIARGDHAKVDTNHQTYKALQTELEWRKEIVEKGSSSIHTGNERDIPDLSPGGIFYKEFEGFET